MFFRTTQRFWKARWRMLKGDVRLFSHIRTLGPSYLRFVDGTCSTSATWGYDNRTVAVRIPVGPPAATRLSTGLQAVT